MRKKKKLGRSTKPSGESKYARRVKIRARAALAVKLPAHTPWPIIWQFRGYY